MKKINELSDKQVLALTNDDLDKMVKLAMAENGIKILSQPIEPVYNELPKKTEKAYSIYGFSFLLKNKEDVDDLAASIRSYTDDMVRSDYISTSFEIKRLRPLGKYDTAGEVKEEYFYSENDLSVLDDANTVNKRLKDTYTELLDEYLAESEKASVVSSEIYQYYNRVMDKYNTMNQMKHRYEEYLSLADGNAKIAMSFLKKAYSIDAETEQYVKDGIVSDIIELSDEKAEETAPGS